MKDIECYECVYLGCGIKMLKWCDECKGYHHEEEWDEEHYERITINPADWAELGDE